MKKDTNFDQVLEEIAPLFAVSDQVMFKSRCVHSSINNGFTLWLIENVVKMKWKTILIVNIGGINRRT